MTPFAQAFTKVLSIGILLVLAAGAAALYALAGNGETARKLRSRLEPHAALLAALIALGGVFGSLAYSEAIGFPPCLLCIIQRAFLYPQAALLGYAAWKFRQGSKALWPLAASIALSTAGGIVALYHSYTQLGGSSLVPCTAEGSACSKVYFVQWGFITIPSMALIAFASIIAFSLIAYRSGRRELTP